MTSSSSANFVDPCSAAVQLDVYPAGDCWLGSLRVPRPILQELECRSQGRLPVWSETIVVLDCSGSMGTLVRRLLNDVLPKAFKTLGMRADDRVTVIGFSDACVVHKTTVGAISKVPFRGCGTTYMCGAVHAVEKLLGEYSAAAPVRILTISDGFVFDCDEVVVAAEKLRAIVTQRADLTIDSKAVRLFTSQAQPDTRAVAALLQLSPTGGGALADMSAELSNKDMAARVSDLFVDNAFNGFQVELRAQGKSNEGLFMENPWLGGDTRHKSVRWWLPHTNDRTEQSSVHDRILWLSHIPSEPPLVLLLNGHVTVSVVQHQSIDNTTYATLLANQVERYIILASLLKVVNTAGSTEEISKMVAFFENVERSLKSTDSAGTQRMDNVEESGSERRERVVLMRRVGELRRNVALRKVMLANRLANIANDSRIATFNSAQSADFLRTVGHGSAAKGLVRRAGMDLDFDQCALEEARAIAAHIDELSVVDDSKHATSFISQGTTLDGLRAVACLVSGAGESSDALTPPPSNDIVEDLTALDILELLNIVGVAANGAVGDYPDPYRYFVRHIHTGAYLSLGDLLTMAKQQRHRGAANRVQTENGESGFAWSGVRVPWSSVPVTDVIPVFEDARIQEFVRRYAPRLLSYTVSLGMRRVIADIPQTVTASCAAGLLHMVRVLQRDPSEVQVSIARMILTTLVRSRDPRKMKEELALFSQVVQPGRLVFTDVFNVSSMLLPLSYTLARDTSTGIPENVQRVMRGLYVHEVWSTVRRVYKGKQDGDAIIQEYLHDLLGIDLSIVRSTKAITPLSYNVDAPVDEVSFPTELKCASSFLRNAENRDSDESNATQESSEQLVNELQADDDVHQNVDEVGAAARKNAHDLFKAIEMLDFMFALPAYIKLLAKGSQSDAGEDTDANLSSQLKDMNKQFSEQSEDRISEAHLYKYAMECFGIDEGTTAIELKRNALVLALLYPTFDVRCVRPKTQTSEQENNNSAASLLPDVANPAAVTALAASYALNEYRSMYTRTLNEKRDEEQRVLTGALIHHICEAPYTEALQFWKNGLYVLPDGTHTSNLPAMSEVDESNSHRLNYYHKRIVDINSAGATELRAALLSSECDTVVDRLPKLEVFLLGRDCTTLELGAETFDGPIVWNSGNTLRGARASSWNRWYEEGDASRARWNTIVKLCMTRTEHVYGRNTANRHTHGNHKLSYWALGYATLESMAESIKQEEWEAYCDVHTNCCGLQEYSKEENKKRQFSLVSASKDSSTLNEAEPPKKKDKKDAK